ncbi:MAG TPA: bifunctional (p)ppGpp synthetase/guanosine-3',5'-bis(diphosphate) 3'-pyrophosphohydrolase [Chloroflexota bacterium]|nr:bifunctional (p)ppGpp synthetase/guanosine-3',5'-bis(diphosphate) 3'-pyrophosphohydrolase [Chloroflexota bacterium]
MLLKIREYQPTADLSQVRAAYEFAAAAHEGQLRGTGEPYVQHPLETALILADLQMDRTTICAGLLHDVPEDTNRTVEQIQETFGSEIAKLVDGVTKLSRIHWETLEEQQAENLRKMFLAMAEDIRVVIVKLCDRLHNVRTLDGKSESARKRIARETLEIYAPLAHRLGIWELKWRLEDGAFYYLEPERYQELKRLLADTRQTREGFIEQAIASLTAELNKHGLEPVVNGRPKHIYSIYNKIQRTGRSFDQLYDLLAIRVQVDSIQSCYAALGIVHSLWHPVPGQFDDYIATPKGNMYQSLHTAVIGPGGRHLEVQIRTFDMHQVAEHGIAAHWRYKEGTGAGDQAFEAKLAWLRQLMDWQQELSSAQEFVDTVKMDLFQDQVYVFTPKGQIKDLPAGSTPLDFAYRIHTDVGHRCIGARVNGKLVSLDYQLKNGEIVEILTSKSSRGPSRDWLNLVQTAHAREKIRQWFKQQQRAQNIARGKEALDKELQRLGLGGLGAIADDKLEEVAQTLHQGSLDHMYAALGYGGLGVQTVIGRLGLRAPSVEVPFPELPPDGAATPASGNRTGAVSVMGVGDLLTRMAPCCKPVPGDEIIGYITRGKGITVHRRDCHNVRSEDEPERLVHVDWGRTGVQTYPVTVRVEAYDREGLLRDVATVVTEEKLNITGATVDVSRNGIATIMSTVEVGSLQQLSRLLSKIEKIKEVIRVSRDVRSGLPTPN